MMRRTISDHYFLGNFINYLQRQQQSCNTIAAAAQSIPNDFHVQDASLIAKWNAAKPFEEIPGRRSIPFLGTAWIMLPIVGKTNLN